MANIRPMAVAVLVLTALLLSPLAAAAASAQSNTAEVSGIVRDHLGGALPGAAIVARHAESGAVVERLTDAQGRFFLPALRTGVWDIAASLAGFEPRTHTGIILDLGRSVTLDFVLSVEGLSENSVAGPGFASLDLAVAKAWGFGRIFSAKSPREMQLGARLSF